MVNKMKKIVLNKKEWAKIHISSNNNIMKINNLLVVFILNALLFAGCQTNSDVLNDLSDDYLVSDVLYPKNAKLKQISFTESVKSPKGGIIITQYEYDNLGRISKESRPMYESGTHIFEENGTIVGLDSYSDYVYNDKGLLEKIIYYHSNIYAGFLNLRTYTYLYDNDGNKIREVVEYPQINQTDSTLYYYENNRLKREDKYSEGYNGSDVWSSKLITYIDYEYDNQGKLIKETTYFAEDNSNTPFRINKHSYQYGVNVKTEVFSYANNEKIGEVKRFYDKNLNLIYVDTKEFSPLSSMMSYVSKYEYY